MLSQVLRTHWRSHVLSRAVPALLSCGAAVTLWTCGGDDSPTNPPANAIAQITVSPLQDTLNFLSATGQFSALAVDSGGDAVAVQINWSSSATAVATVSQAGLVTAHADGMSMISATAGGITGSAMVVVRQVPVAIAKISGDNQSGYVGALLSTALTVEVRDAGGYAIANQPLTWDAAAGELGEVSPVTDSAGRGRAIWRLGETAGPQSVRVLSGPLPAADFSAQAVRPAVASVQISGLPEFLFRGTSTELAVVARDLTGGLLPDPPVTWTSSDMSVITVSADGIVTGLGAGRATVGATVFDGAASVSLIVAIQPPQFGVDSWSPIGPFQIPGIGGSIDSGKLHEIAVAPSDPSIVYVAGGIGSGNQGPWTEPGALRSEDGGMSWTPINTGLTDRVVNSLWVDPQNSDLVLAGTERKGLFRTTNGGANWSLVSSTGPVSDIFRDGNSLLAGAGPGILTSIDNGATWTLQHSTPSWVRTLEVVGTTAVAALENGTILRRREMNASWEVVATHPSRWVLSTSTDPTNTDAIFAVVVGGAAPSGVRRSLDGGATWVDLPVICPTPQTLRHHPDSATLFLGCNPGLYRTTDRGASWTKLGETPWDIRKMFVLSNGTLYLGTDQGVHVTTDEGTSWNHLTGSTRTSIIAGLDVRGSTIVTTVQDFSPIVSFDAGSSWVQSAAGQPDPVLGEGGQLLIDPLAPSSCYSMTVVGFQHSQDGCRTWSQVNWLGGQPDVPYVQPGSNSLIATDPSRIGRIYLATKYGLFRSNDHGLTTEPITGPFPDALAVGVHPQDGNILLVGSTAGLYRSEDDGSSWTRLTLPLAGLPNSIVFHPDLGDIVFVAIKVPGARSRGVVRSVDAGETFVTATAGLTRPDADVHRDAPTSLAIHPAGALAYATPDGLYVSFDLARSWEDVTPSGITDFSDVKWTPDALFASHQGSGVLKALIQE